MNKTRKVQLVAGGVIVALIVAWYVYDAYQKHQATRTVIAMVTDAASRLTDVLKTPDVDPATPEAATTQQRFDAQLAAAQKHLGELRALNATRIRPLADTAYEYLNLSVEILRRIAAVNGHRMQLEVSLQALREHMKADNRSGPWVGEAIRRKERMDRDLRDYRRAADALAQLLGDYAASRQRMAGFVDAGLLPPDAEAERKRSRTLATLKATAEEAEKVGRLDAYR